MNEYESVRGALMQTFRRCLICTSHDTAALRGKVHGWEPVRMVFWRSGRSLHQDAIGLIIRNNSQALSRKAMNYTMFLKSASVSNWDLFILRID
jgi:hypothetical protein